MPLSLHCLSLPLLECSATKDQITVLSEPIRMSLDDCLEYVADDELIEVQALCRLKLSCAGVLESWHNALSTHRYL